MGWVWLLCCALVGKAGGRPRAKRQLGPLYKDAVAQSERRAFSLQPRLYALKGLEAAWPTLRCEAEQLVRGGERGFYLDGPKQHAPASLHEEFVAAVARRHRGLLPREMQGLELYVEYWAKGQALGEGDCDLHTDRDEQFADDFDKLVTAHLSIITYFDEGSPTVVTPMRRCHGEGPFEAEEVELIGVGGGVGGGAGQLGQLHLASPGPGRQLVFDPRFLHGNCVQAAESREEDPSEGEDPSSGEDPSATCVDEVCPAGRPRPRARPRGRADPRRRTVLVVNLWAGHAPRNAPPLGPPGRCLELPSGATSLAELQWRAVPALEMSPAEATRALAGQVVALPRALEQPLPMNAAESSGDMIGALVVVNVSSALPACRVADEGHPAILSLIRTVLPRVHDTTP